MLFQHLWKKAKIRIKTNLVAKFDLIQSGKNMKMEEETFDLYGYPLYYDIAFSFRDIGKEVFQGKREEGS